MSVDFLDSNVFVYLFDEADPAKHAVARGLVHDALNSGCGVIRYPVFWLDGRVSPKPPKSCSVE